MRNPFVEPRFIRRQRKLTAELRLIESEWTAAQGGDSSFAEMIVAAPDKAERVVKLYIALNLPVSDRMLAHFGLSVVAVRAEFWGPDAFKLLEYPGGQDR